MKHLILLFAMILLPAAGFAQSGTTGSLDWSLSGGTLTISGTGVMPDYSITGRPWFGYRESINAVVIENGVTNIGWHAFFDCSSLTSVTISGNVTSIGWYAFSGCSSLTTIIIPMGVTSIGFHAFSGCSNLTSVTIPGSVTSIEGGAFSGCSSLPSIAIPVGVTSIEGSAFSGCSSLTSVTIPGSVTDIGVYAFENCSSLTSVTIPNSVTNLGNGAFWYCYGLTSITVEVGNPSYSSEDGVLFNSAKTTLLQYPGGKTGDYAIPNSVTSIDNGAFWGCSSLTSVTIPNSVTSIGDGVFRSCSSLLSITIPNSVTSIGDNAFQYCSSLPSITIPPSVTSIGDRAFEACSSLLSITIPGSVTSIGDNAFQYCISLPSITIPNSLTSIGNGTFSGCSSLTSITIPPSVTNIGYNAFQRCNSLTSITIPESVTSVGDGAFYYCNSLTSITVETGNPSYSSVDGVLFNSAKTTLLQYPGGKTGDYAIPNGVTGIGDNAFLNCSNLTSVTIPASVTSIGGSAFSSCSSLTSVTVEWTMPLSIPSNTFQNVPLSYVSLHVPTGTEALYETADVWKEFGNNTTGAETACNLTTLTVSTGELYDAIVDLCSRTVLSGSDENGAVAETAPLKRAHLAKIAFRGLYLLNGGTVPTTLPSDYYPSIYPDLNAETPQNKYYYRPAKALLYLEYGDGVSPFDRNRTSFLPDATIERVNVLKVLLETFNIAPDLDNSSSPFPSDADVTALRTNDPFKTGYIRKALQLGIIDAATEFHPFADCLRGEAFLMLYRLMTKVEASLIADPAPTVASYYEPLNVTLRTAAMGLGLSLGNFNHYTKTSFAIGGVTPLSFSHTYNSYTTDLPDEFYGIHDLGQGKLATYRPLGYGWSHEYHSYATQVVDRLILHWGGGTIHVYKSDGVQWVAESVGVYDEVSFEGTTLLVKSKSQVEYRFKKQTPSGTGANILQLYSIKDRNGNELVINYTAGEDEMMVVSSVSGAGRQLTFSYKSGTNLIEQVTDPLSRSVQFGYSFNPALNSYLLTSFTDAKGQTTQYEYGNQSSLATCRLLKKIQLPKSNYIENEYDANRRLSKSVAGVSGVPTTQTAISVNANWQSQTLNSTVQQSRGSATSSTAYTFNMQNSVTAVTGDEYLEVVATYTNAAHVTLPTSVRTNKSDIENIQYDAKGNVTQITQKFKGGVVQEPETGNETQTVSMTYNNRNDVTGITDARGNATYYDYDGNGNLIKIRAPENAETSLECDAKGLVTATVNPEGIRTEVAYNTYGNPTEIKIPTLGITAKSEYDAASRLTAVTDFLNRKTAYSYDANDNLTSEVNPANHTTGYTYDVNDNLTAITNAKGGVTSLTYDNATDWLTSVSFGGATKQFAYNPDGTLRTFTKPDGSTLSFTYDALGRVTDDGVRQYRYSGDMHQLGSVTQDGRPLYFWYDGFNHIREVSTYSGDEVPNGIIVHYEHDANGNIVEIWIGGSKVTYTYDKLNRMTSVADWFGKTITYTYRKDSKLQSVTYPNGMTVSYTYDNAGRQTGKTVKRADNSVIASWSFTLDNTGNILSETRTEPYTDMILPADDVTYTYNSANRIQTAGSVSFAFDANGNTTSRDGSNYTYDRLDKLTSGDGFNFEYDGLGHIRSDGSKRYTIDITGMGNVLAETDLSGNPAAYYLYGQGLEARILPNGTTEYYVSDYRGSIVAMVDASTSANITHKYQYDDFGNVTQKQESDANPFRYVGKYGVMHVNDNLYYMRARFYDPTIGRFLSEDPIWSTNLYPYADNNPIMGIDPRGLSTDFNRERAEYVYTYSQKLLNEMQREKANNSIRGTVDVELEYKIRAQEKKVQAMCTLLYGECGNSQPQPQPKKTNTSSRQYTIVDIKTGKIIGGTSSSSSSNVPFEAGGFVNATENSYYNEWNGIMKEHVSNMGQGLDVIKSGLNAGNYLNNIK